MALFLIIIAPNGHILANIAIVSQLVLAIDLSSKGLPGQLRLISLITGVPKPRLAHGSKDGEWVTRAFRAGSEDEGLFSKAPEPWGAWSATCVWSGCTA